MSTLRKGSLAYYDTFSGLVPCKVLAVRDAADLSVPMRFELLKGGVSSRYKVDVRLTATRCAYRKGEVLTDLFAHDVVPREAVRFRKYNAMIVKYEVEVEGSEQ